MLTVLGIKSLNLEIHPTERFMKNTDLKVLETMFIKLEIYYTNLIYKNTKVDFNVAGSFIKPLEVAPIQI